MRERETINGVPITEEEIATIDERAKREGKSRSEVIREEIHRLPATADD